MLFIDRNEVTASKVAVNLVLNWLLSLDISKTINEEKITDIIARVILTYQTSNIR